MKLIIDIPEEVLNSIKTFKGKFICENGYDLIQGIKNGTPLDDVKAERMKVTEKEYVCMWGLTVKVTARSEAEAKKKCADSLTCV